MTTRQQTIHEPRPIERHPGELASEVLDDLLDALRQRRGDLAAEMADDLRRMVSLDGYAPPSGLTRYATTTFALAAQGLSIHLPGGEYGPVVPKGEPDEGDRGGLPAEGDGLPALPGPLAVLAACGTEADSDDAADIDLSPADREVIGGLVGFRDALRSGAVGPDDLGPCPSRRRAARRAQRRDAADLAEYVELPPLDDEPDDDAITEAARYEAAADVFADLTSHITGSEGVS